MTTKCDSYFITICERSLLQNASGFLLENASDFLLENTTVLLQNANSYYKLRQLHYKMRRLLQIAIVQPSFTRKLLARSIEKN